MNNHDALAAIETHLTKWATIQEALTQMLSEPYSPEWERCIMQMGEYQSEVESLVRLVRRRLDDGGTLQEDEWQWFHRLNLSLDTILQRGQSLLDSGDTRVQNMEEILRRENIRSEVNRMYDIRTHNRYSGDSIERS